MVILMATDGRQAGPYFFKQPLCMRNVFFANSNYGVDRIRF